MDVAGATKTTHAVVLLHLNTAHLSSSWFPMEMGCCPHNCGTTSTYCAIYYHTLH